jgi:hypothetical protein
MSLLRQAVARGLLRDADELNRPDLAPLRGRDEFEELRRINVPFGLRRVPKVLP